MNSKVSHLFRLFLLSVFFLFCLSYLSGFGDSDAFAFHARPLRIITLNDAYTLAAHRNDTIKATKESYYQSTLLKWSAVGMILPNIRLIYKDQRMHFNSPAAPSSSSGSNPLSFLYPNYEYSFMLSQPILNVGAIPAYRAAQNMIAFNKMNLNDISSATLYNVAVDYYTVISDLSLIKADSKTLSEAKTHLRLSEARLGAGLAIVTDVLQAKSQFYAARQQLLSSKNALKTVKADLAALLGISRYFRVANPSEPVFKKAPLRTYIALAYKNNSGLRALKFAKKAADDETMYYESQYIPTISFTASYSALSNSRFIPNGSLSYWTAGATLTMPIFQGSTRIVSIEKARSAANQSMYNTTQAKRNLKARVISEFYNIQNLRYEVITLRHEERFASKNYELVEEEYKAGVATSVDVVTAMAELTKARHNLLSAGLGYDKSVLGLKRLTGSFKEKLISLTEDRFN